ncbi:MAG: lysophospholipid acyltransferase family protein [Thermoanaerobaculia bacterium]
MTTTTTDLPPLPTTLGARLARWAFGIAGWRLEGRAPSDPHCIILGVPHTTNWDLALAILTGAGLGFRLRWLGKDSVFWEPLGTLMRWVGGIPVDRSSRTGMVQALVARMKSEREFALCIAPEGTRKYTDHWKSGFYRIALAADIPVILGFCSYDRKIVGLGPAIRLTGDRDADMAKIASFYADKRGKHLANESAIRLLPDEAS